MTPIGRIEAAIRVTGLVRKNIHANGNEYDGRFAPNLQTIIDVLTIPDDLFSSMVTDERLTDLESGPFPRYGVLK